MDLVSLIEQQSSIRLVQRATTGNGEYWGMCPFCKAGTDRFHVWPSSQRPHYWCRNCNAAGDAIQFLRDYSSMSYVEACNELGIETDHAGWAPAETETPDGSPPPKLWQEAGKNFVERAARYLWGNAPSAKEALAYLRGRGLNDDMVRHKKYGYCPLTKEGRWYSDEFEAWGLDPANLTPEQLKKGCLRIPNGIILPWFESDTLWKIAVKRPGEQMDYGQVMGSAEGLYNVSSIQYEKPVMLVEAEFCAASVEQEAGDLVSCIATGSTARGRNPRWAAELSQASFIVQSFDDDEPGEQGKRAGDDGAVYWLNQYEKCFRFEPVAAKDPNDMLRVYDGTFVRDWVQAALDMWEALQWPSSLPEPTPARARYPEIAHCAIEIMPSEQTIKITEYKPTKELPIVIKDTDKEEMAPHWQNLQTKIEHRANVLNAQAEFERLCISDRVQTPQGPGKYWDAKLLQEHCERGQVRVTLDSGETLLFAPCQLEPVLEAAQLSLAF